jgi:hypothetical protein
VDEWNIAPLCFVCRLCRSTLKKPNAAIGNLTQRNKTKRKENKRNATQRNETKQNEKKTNETQRNTKKQNEKKTNETQ